MNKDERQYMRMVKIQNTETPYILKCLYLLFLHRTRCPIGQSDGSTLNNWCIKFNKLYGIDIPERVEKYHIPIFLTSLCLFLLTICMNKCWSHTTTIITAILATLLQASIILTDMSYWKKEQHKKYVEETIKDGINKRFSEVYKNYAHIHN